jgi:hypothetical protein
MKGKLVFYQPSTPGNFSFGEDLPAGSYILNVRQKNSARHVLLIKQ